MFVIGADGFSCCAAALLATTTTAIRARNIQPPLCVQHLDRTSGECGCTIRYETCLQRKTTSGQPAALSREPRAKKLHRNFTPVRKQLFVTTAIALVSPLAVFGQAARITALPAQPDPGAIVRLAVTAPANGDPVVSIRGALAEE